jgi:hypothetical protein
MLLCLAKALGRRVMAGYAGHPVLGFYLDQLCN